MNVLIIGGSGGLGLALVELFCGLQDTTGVTATYRTQQPELANAKLTWVPLDVTAEADITRLFATCPELTYIINAAGLLH